MDTHKHKHNDSNNDNNNNTGDNDNTWHTVIFPLLRLGRGSPKWTRGGAVVRARPLRPDSLAPERSGPASPDRDPSIDGFSSEICTSSYPLYPFCFNTMAFDENSGKSKWHR